MCSEFNEMNKADLYKKSDENSRHDAQQALQDFANIIKWRSDGYDSMLDAGCGPGDLTREVLLPFLPSNFKRLVGIDFSDEMVNYARTKQIHPKLSFEFFNLNVELEKQHLSKIEPFDHIFSSYCLQMVQNQKILYHNFFKLLKPGGDMLLLFLFRTPIYDTYKQLSMNSKWAKYMKDVDNSKLPYQDAENPGEEYRKFLMNAGFIDCDIRVYDKGYVLDFDTMKSKLLFFFIDFN